jgi:hypothetical protein
VLDHQEIIATAEHVRDESEKASSLKQTSSSVASSLNYNNGVVSTVTTGVLQNFNGETVHQQIRNNQQEGEQALAQR